MPCPPWGEGYVAKWFILCVRVCVFFPPLNTLFGATLLFPPMIHEGGWVARTGSRQAHRRRLRDGAWCTLAANQNNWHLWPTDGHTGGVTGGVGRALPVCVSCFGVCARPHSHSNIWTDPPSANMSAGGIYRCSYTAPIWLAEALHSVTFFFLPPWGR